MSWLRAVIPGVFAVLASAANAQAPPAAVARAAIEKVSADGASLIVRTRTEKDETIRLTDATTVTRVVPAKLADVKAGAFVGVAAVPDADGALKALELHIFPESMRGTGEGFHPFDLAPNSSMTNGAIAARVEGVAGTTLTVAYRGGRQTIVIDAETPIVAFAPGVRADLAPGAAIVARGARQDDGSIAAAHILVGENGFVPPL